MKNHLGSYECKLCLTLHNNEVRPRPRPAPAPPHLPAQRAALLWSRRVLPSISFSTGGTVATDVYLGTWGHPGTFHVRIGVVKSSWCGSSLRL